MEFGDPLHILGSMVLVSFLSMMIGMQLGTSEKEHEKNR